jgi:putative membrane protein
MYSSHYFWGMHFIWWFVWMGLMFWIFFTPYMIPGERRRKEGPLDILRKRYVAGEITKELYEEHKKILEMV